MTICDPACGCGSFLISLSKHLNDIYNITYTNIFKNMVFGVDIVAHNVERSNNCWHSCYKL